MDAALIVVIAFSVIVLIGSVLIVLLVMTRRDHPSDRGGGLGRGKDFLVYNYLDKSIRIDVHHPEGVTVLTSGISPRKSQGFKMCDIERNLICGNIFKIYVLDETCSGERLYANYTLDIPEGTTIKNLHVGMITTRWVGADSDYNIGKPGANAVQGLPWVRIHNYTDYPLSINNNIDISPGGTLRYTGRDHFGVRLGTVFKDQDGIFPNYIFTVPATDIYYGVVSDIQQPIFGGFQLTPDFNDDPDEPQFLLEEGWMGGPAWGNIPYGLLPIEGPNVPPQDRWGIPATPSEIHSPVGPPVEM